MSRKRIDSNIGKCDGVYFGTLVKELRLERKMTIQTFATRVGICRNYVSQLESGDKLPSFETLILISKVLEVTPNDLLVDYVASEKSAEIRSVQITRLLSKLTEEQQKHVYKMMLTEIDFLKKQ